MQNFLGQEKLWFPLKFLGLTSNIYGVNVDTVMYTWLAIAVLTIILLIARYFLTMKNSVYQYVVQSMISPFIDMVEQTAGKFNMRYYLFTASLFIFILSCNWIALIPGVSEPTKDLNTTIALSIITFVFIQKEMIKAHGFGNYLKEYFIPFDNFFPLNLIAGLILFPIKLLGELVASMSLALRLFGNIFGGYIIMHLFHMALGQSILYNILGIPFALIISAFFIFFEGFLQAFVFSILALTNTTMAVQSEDEGPL